MARPDIPKRLAARIRGAQERVRQKRISIVASEHNNRQSRTRVEAFECDPEAFAARYYRGHGVDSYPVQTTIARERERLEYHARRHDERISELAELEVALGATEAAVLSAVAAMRPSNGRISWPKPLAPFPAFRREFEAEMARLAERLAKADAQRARKWAEEDRRHAEREAQRDQEFQENFAKLSECDQGFLSHIRDGIAAGEFSIFDVFSVLQRSNETPERQT
jgi:hypothetical protein